jgi:hypothetical protein
LIFELIDLHNVVNKRTAIKPKRFYNSKSSFAVLSSRKHKTIRRAFRNFSTEEAWTFVVRFKGKRRFCRVDRGKNARYLAEHRRLVLDLFHRLYPKNSITPVGLLKVPASAIISAYPEEFSLEKNNSNSDWFRESWQKKWIVKEGD